MQKCTTTKIKLNAMPEVAVYPISTKNKMDTVKTMNGPSMINTWKNAA